MFRKKKCEHKTSGEETSEARERKLISAHSMMLGRFSTTPRGEKSLNVWQFRGPETQIDGGSVGWLHEFIARIWGFWGFHLVLEVLMRKRAESWVISCTYSTHNWTCSPLASLLKPHLKLHRPRGVKINWHEIVARSDLLSACRFKLISI